MFTVGGRRGSVGARGSYLRDVHHRVTAQGSGGGEVVEAQKGGNDPVLVDPTDHGPVHEEDDAVLIHRDAYTLKQQQQQQQQISPGDAYNHELKQQQQYISPGDGYTVTLTQQQQQQ